MRFDWIYSGVLFCVPISFLFDIASVWQAQTCTFFRRQRLSGLLLAPGGHHSTLCLA